MRLVVMLCCLAGCDALFRLSQVQPDAPGTQGVDAAPDAGADGGMTCFTEAFSGSNADLAVNWDMYADSAACRASIINGELGIEIDPNVSCYAGVTLIGPRSLVGARITVKVSSPLAPAKSQTLFALERDVSNYYYFDCGNGYLDLVAKIGGQDMYQTTIPYGNVSHLYWRFQHDPFGKQVEFLTSPNGTDFTFRHAIRTDSLAVDPMILVLGAGTYDGGQASPGIARFDDFELCVP